jgi:hypothetical protein
MLIVLKWAIRLVDNVFANILATIVATGGVSGWAISRNVPGYAVAAIAIGVAAGTLLLLVQLRALLWQSYSAFYLGILRDIGINMLLNRPVSGAQQEARLEADLSSWQDQVTEVMKRVGARDSEVRRFRILGNVPLRHQGSSPNHTNLMNQVAEKVERLEGLIDRLDRP